MWGKDYNSRLLIFWNSNFNKLLAIFDSLDDLWKSEVDLRFPDLRGLSDSSSTLMYLL